jgi:hypothetical protein
MMFKINLTADAAAALIGTCIVGSNQFVVAGPRDRLASGCRAQSRSAIFACERPIDEVARKVEQDAC